jgi:DNA sulfur modification protein DndE
VVHNCTVYRAHGGFVIGSEMSGGVKNMYVSDCTFMGTDVGLRFKSVRGRGGVVRDIYVSKINMENIRSEAVYFDVYYQATDQTNPPLAGEKVAMPKIEIKPVDDGTPTFRDFYFHNIVCRGANKAIFIRGLPEMNIKNVLIDNAVLQASQGVYCEEADSVSLKNITVLADNNNPVILVENSNKILFDNFKYKDSADLLINVGGDRTKDIRLLNTDLAKAKKQTDFFDNAKPDVLTTH